MRARGAERNLGPDYLVACDDPGLRPCLQWTSATVRATDRVLRAVQITGVDLVGSTMLRTGFACAWFRL
jgi:hypothetical protein